jgi:hypothetical protein
MVHWERAGPMRGRIGLESEAERAIGVGLGMDGPGQRRAFSTKCVEGTLGTL